MRILIVLCIVLGLLFLDDATLIDNMTPNIMEACENPYGFLWGTLHGFVALINLILSFFIEVGIYEVCNDGRWYNVGFVIGNLLFWGGSFVSSKSNK